MADAAPQANPLQNIGWETRSLSIPHFDGCADPNEFIRKFDLMIDQFGWDDDQKLFRFKFYMTKSAGVWVRSLPEAERDTYEHIRTSFENHYIRGESAIVLESQLQSLRLGPNLDIDSYLSQLLDIGSRLNRTPDTLAVSFLNGLPPNMQEFCASSDILTLTNYVNRSKLYKARHPTSSTPSVTPGLAAYMGDESIEEDKDDEQDYEGDLACALSGLRSDLKEDRDDRKKYWNNRNSDRGRGQRWTKWDRRPRKEDKRDLPKAENRKKMRCFACESDQHLIASCPWDPDKKSQKCKFCSMVTHGKKKCPFNKESN